MIKNLEIIDYTYDGLGIGKVEDFPIFVSGAVVGDILDVEISKQKKNLAFAKIVNIVKSSNNRVEPRCQHYDQCGGCHLMHLSYPEQLRFKTKHVKETLKRIGNVEAIVENCMGMDNPYNYRNKLIMPCKDGKAGLYKKGTHEIIDIEKCYILDDYGVEIVKYLKTIFDNNLRNILIRNSCNHDKYMVVLITYFKIKNEVVEDLISKFPKIESVINNINDKIVNTVLGANSHVLYGNDYYKDSLLNNNYIINYRSFYQVNSSQTEKLYQEAINCFDLTDLNVIDAYSGIGTIGLSFSKKAKKVYGIEINETSVENARENAVNNNISNIEFLLGKAEEVITKIIDRNIDIVITDPPRKGCGVEFIDSIIKNKIKNVVYISCNVSTLARDISILKEEYHIIKVVPVDMFPQTHHIEVVVGLSRKID